MKRFYEGLIYLGNMFQHPLLLLLRLYWGYSFFQTGWGKLHNIEVVSGYFHSLNIPLPMVNAYIASTIECVGGALLLIGLGSRLIAIPLIFVMIIAYMTTELTALKMIFSDPANFISQAPFTYLLTCLIVFAFGPGMFSIDGLLKRFFAHRSS